MCECVCLVRIIVENSRINATVQVNLMLKAMKIIMMMIIMIMMMTIMMIMMIVVTIIIFYSVPVPHATQTYL